MTHYHIRATPKKPTPNKVQYNTVDGVYYIPNFRLRTLLGLTEGEKGKAPGELFITVSTEQPADYDGATEAVEFEL